MSNDYYNDSSVPGTGGTLSSAQIRAEFQLIESAFAKLPILANLIGGASNSAVTTGSADAYLATISPGPTAYAARQRYTLTINATNTGASTLNINSLGIRTIKRLDGSDLEAGDLQINRTYDFVYDSITDTIALMTLMPNTVQSTSPTFVIVNTTENVTARQVGVDELEVSISGGNVNFPLDEAGVFYVEVDQNCTASFSVTDTSKAYPFLIIVTTTGSFDFTGLSMSGTDIITDSADTNLDLLASGITVIGGTYMPSQDLLMVMYKETRTL